jgi:RNA polymerase sigma factor (sigma-70 family)
MDYGLLAEDVLLKLLKISDELAYKEIYLRYWRRLYASAVSKTNSKEVAEDLVQSVFTVLWERRERHAINSIAAYLETAVKYQIINYIKSAISKRAQYTGFGELQKAEENSADLPLLVQELNTAIDKAINQLPQKTQTTQKNRYDPIWRVYQKIMVITFSQWSLQGPVSHSEIGNG